MACSLRVPCLWVPEVEATMFIRWVSDEWTNGGQPRDGSVGSVRGWLFSNLVLLGVEMAYVWLGWDKTTGRSFLLSVDKRPGHQ
jgi:hypothetical protein